MDKNEFDDIILDKGNKGDKIKKILLRAIVLVILFLVVLVIMKLINDDPKENSLVPSESLLNENNASHFENTPVIKSELIEDEFEALKRQLQAENNQSLETEKNQEQNLSNEDLNEQNLSMMPDNTAFKENKTSSQMPKQDIKQESKEELKQEPKKEVKQAPKQEVKKKEQSANDLFKNINTNTQDKLIPGTYIQVFSLTNLDSKSKELSLLRQNGYEYKIYKTKVRGKEVIKILVGPFAKNIITKEMSKIRANINKDAFVFSIK